MRATRSSNVRDIQVAIEVSGPPDPGKSFSNAWRWRPTVWAAAIQILQNVDAEVLDFLII
jgi:hypothetical protein